MPHPPLLKTHENEAFYCQDLPVKINLSLALHEDGEDRTYLLPIAPSTNGEIFDKLNIDGHEKLKPYPFRRATLLTLALLSLDIDRGTKQFQ